MTEPEVNNEFHPVEQSLFKISLWRRITYTSSDSRLFGKHIVMTLDNVGFFYVYKDEHEREPDYVRKHLFMREQAYAIIEARSANEAIQKFYNEWEGAMTGGSREESKALWINREIPITVLPRCREYVWHLKNGEINAILCGMPTEDDGEPWGYYQCVLEGYDRDNDSFCPLKEGIDPDKTSEYITIENGLVFKVVECNKENN